MRHRLALRAALFVMAAAPAVVSAQESPPPAPIPQDSVQLLLQRFQALQAQVGAAQQEVMNTTPALQARQAEVSEMVEARVYEIDSTLQADIRERMPSIAQRAEAAEAAGDTLALQAVQREYAILRGRAEEAERAALLEPDIRSAVRAFEERMKTEMEARDPEIGDVMAELESLAGRLDATLSGG